MKLKNEEGIIAIYVILALLFLLIITMVIYILVNNKLVVNNQSLLDIKELFINNSNNGSDDIKYADSNEIIKIYNSNDFDIVGTGAYIKKDSVLYQCGLGMTYKLMNNILVDINEDIILSGSECNDYKLYSKYYHIDNDGYSIYYYHNNSYYKLLAYQNFSSEEPQNSNSIENFEKDKYINLKLYDNSFGQSEFIMVYGNKVDSYTVDESKQSIFGKIYSLSQVEVYNRNINKLKKDKDSYYLFVKINNI